MRLSQVNTQPILNHESSPEPKLQAKQEHLFSTPMVGYLYSTVRNKQAFYYLGHYPIVGSYRLCMSTGVFYISALRQSFTSKMRWSPLTPRVNRILLNIATTTLRVGERYLNHGPAGNVMATANDAEEDYSELGAVYECNRNAVVTSTPPHHVSSHGYRLWAV